jgi:hypothetical protein
MMMMIKCSLQNHANESLLIHEILGFQGGRSLYCDLFGYITSSTKRLQILFKMVFTIF